MTAEASALAFAFAAPWRPVFTELKYDGKAIAVRMPRINTTTKSSMRVKPFLKLRELTGVLILIFSRSLNLYASPDFGVTLFRIVSLPYSTGLKRASLKQRSPLRFYPQKTPYGWSQPLEN